MGLYNLSPKSIKLPRLLYTKFWFIYGSTMSSEIILHVMDIDNFDGRRLLMSRDLLVLRLKGIFKLNSLLQ